MEDQEDIDEMISEIMEDENLTWIQKKAAMIAILSRKMEYGDYTVYHECPKCNMVWWESPTDDGAFQFREEHLLKKKDYWILMAIKLNMKDIPKGYVQVAVSGLLMVDGKVHQ